LHPSAIACRRPHRPTKSARSSVGIDALLDAAHGIATGRTRTRPFRLAQQSPDIEAAVTSLAEVVDEVTPAYGRLIAGAGALGVPAPLRARDDAWQLEVLAHPHGPRVLRACILAPDGRPAVSVAVAEGGGDGARHAWRETVAASAWFIEGCDLAEFRDPPDGPWLMGALQDGLDGHPEAFEWLGAVLPYIGWAFLDSLSTITIA